MARRRRRRGSLARALLGRVYAAAQLGTETAALVRERMLEQRREGALRLYLGLGFHPLICDDTHPARWQAIAEKLNRPGILTRTRDLRSASCPSQR